MFVPKYFITATALGKTFNFQPSTFNSHSTFAPLTTIFTSSALFGDRVLNLKEARCPGGMRSYTINVSVLIGVPVLDR
jgi:hypothetical protein